MTSQDVEALLLDLLEWLAVRPRSYGEVMEAWRTSCPRLPVWEEATDRGLVSSRHRAGQGRIVAISPAGRAWLRRHDRLPLGETHSGGASAAPS
jgi:DNA-binding PadR family transcriptional regulator